MTAIRQPSDTTRAAQAFRSLGRRSVWVAPALAVALLYGLWFVAFSADSTTVSDDGVYAITAIDLSSGRDGVIELPHFDTAGRYQPYRTPVFVDGGLVLAPRHAVWSTTLAGAYAALGDAGLRVLQLASLASCVFVASRFAVVFGRPGAARWAAWLTAASPLLAHSLNLWAHVPMAACAAAALWLALQTVNGFWSTRSMVGVIVLCAVASVLRNDGVLYSAALAVTCVLIFATQLGRDRGAALRAGVLGCAAGVAAVIGFLLGRLASQGLAGESAGASSPAPGKSRTIAEGAGAAVNTLFGIVGGTATGFVLLVLGTSAVLVAVLLSRDTGITQRRALLVIAGALLLVLRSFVSPDTPITGLLGAWSIVSFVLLVPWRTVARPAHWAVLYVGIATAAVLLTQYPTGGGLTWGARFLAPLIPALAALAAIGIQRAIAATSAELHPEKVVVLLVVCLLLTMLVFDGTVRQRYERQFSRIGNLEDASFVITTLDHIALADWQGHPDRRWLRVDDDPADLAVLLDELRLAGVETVGVYGIDRAQAQDLLRVGIPDGLTWSGVFYEPVRVDLGGAGSGDRHRVSRLGADG